VEEQLLKVAAEKKQVEEQLHKVTEEKKPKEVQRKAPRRQ
jgi:hypothetical protein